jgi:hypothetical protein
MNGKRSNLMAVRLPDWLDMHQALAWASFRDMEFAARANPDTLTAEHLWPSMIRIAGRADLALALQDMRLVAQGARRAGDWETIPSAQWQRLDIAPRDSCRHEPYEMIRVAQADLLKVFPPLALARATYVENVAWCEEWMASGKGNGMDKAWPSFTRELQHEGTSRDSFRLAWNEAKGKKVR